MWQWFWYESIINYSKHRANICQFPFKKFLNYCCNKFQNKLSKTIVSKLSVSTFANCKCRRPLWPKNIQTDASIAVNVRVIDSGSEGKLQEKTRNDTIPKQEILLTVNSLLDRHELQTLWNQRTQLKWYWMQTWYTSKDLLPEHFNLNQTPVLQFHC